VSQIGGRVTVLRVGALAAEGDVEDISQASLVAAMVGSAPPSRATEIAAVAKKQGALGEKQLDVSGLTVHSLAGSVYEVSLSVRAGECVGLVGLDGSGTATVADAVVGLMKPPEHAIAIQCRAVRLGNVAAVLDRGVGYVPQDRQARGFAPHLRGA